MVKESRYPVLQQLVAEKWFRWAVRIGAALLLLPVVLLLVGFIYQSIAVRLEARRLPPPGELVDVGGYRLHINCTGKRAGDRPTVVLVAGAGSSSADWVLVQPEVSESTRVCSYDRAGLGWSDPAQRPRTTQHMADELHRLLTSAGEPGPYVLVGHSLGGHTIRLYTQVHPDEVEGMVLIDPRLDDSSANSLTNRGRSDANLAFWGWMSRFGVFRLIGPFLYGPVYQEKMPDHPYGFLLGPQFFETERIESEVIGESDHQVQACGPFGDLPLVVITSDIPNMFGALSPEEEPVVAALIRDGHTRMAGLSTQGRVVVAQGSGHIIPVERSDIVIETILEMVGG